MSDNHDRSADLPTWLRERIEADCTAEGEYEEYRNGVWAGAESCYRALLEAGPEFDPAKAYEASEKTLARKDDGFCLGADWQHSQDRVALAAQKVECERLDKEVREWMDKSDANWRRAEFADANAALKGLDKFESLEAEVARLRSALEKIERHSRPGMWITSTDPGWAEIAREALRGGK